MNQYLLLLTEKLKFYCRMIVMIFICANESGFAQNRILLNIDGSSFTQRQLEVYVLVKDILGLQEFKLRLDSLNWSAIKSEFVVDMVVNIESGRFGAFRANPQQLSDWLNIANGSVSDSKEVAREFARLDLSAQELQRTIELIMRIEASKRQKQVGLNGDKGAKAKFTDPVGAKWFESLRSKANVHWSDGADQWVPYTNVPAKAENSAGD